MTSPHVRMAEAVDLFTYGYLLDRPDWIEQANRRYEEAAIDLQKQWRDEHPEEWAKIKQRLKTWAKGSE